MELNETLSSLPAPGGRERKMKILEEKFFLRGRRKNILNNFSFFLASGMSLNGKVSLRPLSCLNRHRMIALEIIQFAFYLIGLSEDWKNPFRSNDVEGEVSSIVKLQIHNDVYTTETALWSANWKASCRWERKISHFDSENSSFSDDIQFNENCFSIPFAGFFNRHWSAIDRHEQHIRLIPPTLCRYSGHQFRRSYGVVRAKCVLLYNFARFIFGILTILLMFFRTASGRRSTRNDRQKGELCVFVAMVVGCANSRMVDGIGHNVKTFSN